MTSAYFAHVSAAFAIVAITLTVFLAKTLSRNGEVFLRDVFVDKPELAHAVNQLLVVGFYLFNFGWACTLIQPDYGAADTVNGAITFLASKLGSLLLSLAAMHFVNVIIFHRIRRRATLQQQARPPIAPTHHLRPTTSAGFPNEATA